MARPKVLFIGGAGRSGSTLLDLMLGELDGYVAVGELAHIWERGVLESQLCGCGEPFGDCDTWQRILEASHPGLDRAGAEHLLGLKQRLCRTYRVPELLFPKLRSARTEAQMREYGEALDKVYRSVRDEFDSDVIVDASKNPAEASLLYAACDVDLYVVHLIRDARGVARSWQRKKKRPEIHWKNAHMPRYSPLTTSVAWNLYNGIFEYLGHLSGRYTRVRYEDMTAKPVEVLERITAMVGHTPPIDVVDDHTVHLTSNHTVSGNPMRFKSGDIELRQDRAWRREMPRWQKSLVAATTLPLLRRYDYL